MALPQRSYPPPQRPPQRHNNARVYHPPRRSSKKNKRKKQLATLAVMSGMVLVLFVVALLVASLNKSTPSSVVISSVMPPPSQSIAASSVPVSVAPTRQPTLFDETGNPPLYNFENYIPDGYLNTISLVDIGNGQRMETKAAEAYKAMQAAASDDGIRLVPLSGYRSHERQTNNYNASIQRYLDQGLSRDEAVRRTQAYYAIPGTSEHEAGVAIDIGDAEAPGTNINDGFEKTKAYTWLQQHCVEYGFILRYKSDTFDITHINYEPWHYRYVGANHAELITEQGITLEEYIASLGNAPSN